MARPSMGDSQRERRLFGTDGIRGTANVEPMTSETAMRVGRALAHLVRRGTGRHRIVIGKDTRLSGYMIEQALACGVLSMGVDVLFVGPLPTPAIAFLTNGMRADAGAVISASHNPFQDNGIKFFSRDGFKLPDATELEIENLIFTGEIDHLRPTADAVGKAFRVDDAAGRTIVFLKATFPRDLTLEGLRIALDCAHGAAYRVAPAVFEELGAKVHAIGIEPNGTNINEGCGSTRPEVVAEEVRRRGADLGIALDGDADRVVFADAAGRIVDGDHLMAIAGLHLLGRGKLEKKTVVGTTMSNLGLELALARAGGRLVRAPVGDRYVLDAMRSGGYNLGGEQSGHVIFLDHATTGDGVLTALQVLAIMIETGKSLADLASVLVPLPQVLLTIPVRSKPPLEELAGVEGRIRAAERDLASSGRVVVRYSGTEMAARVMIEGEDRARIEAHASGIAEELSRALG